jgi:hypothetical protein
MTRSANNEDRFGGAYMVQDRNHMGEIRQAPEKAGHGRARRAEQSPGNGHRQSTGKRSAARPGSHRH